MGHPEVVRWYKTQGLKPGLKRTFVGTTEVVP